MTSKTVLNDLKPSYFWQVWCPKCALRRWLPQVLASSLQLLECAGTSRPKFQHRCNPYTHPSLYSSTLERGGFGIRVTTGDVNR